MKLTFRIKVNDEITLKHHHPDPKVNAYWEWKMMFSDERCSVEAVDKVHDKCWVTVRTRKGFSIRVPIECISKNYCLRRDHKRICLANKTLICE